MERRILGIIGAGAMGTAIIRGLLRGGHLAENILVCEPDPARAQSLSEWGINIQPNNQSLVKQAQGIIVAVKPQVLPEVLNEIADGYHAEVPLLSVAAGVSTTVLGMKLPEGTAVVRAMPNTPALIGEGVTALCGGKNASMEDISWAHELLSPLGKVVLVREELMDAVTGLSGSGPAYVYLFMEALIEAGVRAGIPRDTAKDLAYHTLQGSIKMAFETKEHPAKLREQVTSPGGTTAAALSVLERGAFRSLVSDAVWAAMERSKVLGNAGNKTNQDATK